MVSWWCLGCLLVVCRWCLQVVSQWCHGVVLVVSELFLGGVSLVSLGGV